MPERNKQRSILTKLLKMKRFITENGCLSRPDYLIVSVCLMLLTGQPLRAQENQLPVELKETGGAIQVLVGPKGGQDLFTEYRWKDLAKPALYPIMAPGQVAITRHFPFDKSHESEANDHPHHKSLWFAHGDVNGADYWSEKAKIQNRTVGLLDDGKLVATHEWLSPDGDQVLCIDRTEMQFWATDKLRFIDYTVTVSPHNEPVTFGDTKEGTFGLRTHPALRIVDRDRKPVATAFNSRGVKGADIWGKAAEWVHYAGEIGGENYSITVMDHPDSFRAPTTWHAREYGLIAANPFGLSYFQKKPKGSGDFTVAPGESVTFRYGVLLSRGKLGKAEIDRVFELFSSK